MADRTKETTITFVHPFTLASVGSELPAGSYTVEVDEEELAGLSFVAYRRVATLLHIPGRAGDGLAGEVVPILSWELDAAIQADARSAAAPTHGA